MSAVLAEPADADPARPLEAGAPEEPSPAIDPGGTDAWLDGGTSRVTPSAIEPAAPRGRLPSSPIDSSTPMDAAEPNVTVPDAGSMEAAEGGGAFRDGALVAPSIDDMLRAKLYGCAAVGPGPYHPQPIRDDRMHCIARCILEAPCDEVRHYLCFDDAPIILTCSSDCEALDIKQPFDCGNQQLIWAGFVCDSRTHCENGADESSCPKFACADGTAIAVSGRCDGLPGCRDGSDEEGCASTCLSDSTSQ